MKSGHRYEVGDQPCQNLKRAREGAGWENVHQCPKCGGNRTFCETCCRDHHDGGWEACQPGAFVCEPIECPDCTNGLDYGETCVRCGGAAEVDWGTRAAAEKFSPLYVSTKTGPGRYSDLARSIGGRWVGPCDGSES